MSEISIQMTEIFFEALNISQFSTRGLFTTVVYKSVFIVYYFPIGIYLQKYIFKNIMMTSGFIFKNILADRACQKKL